MQSEVHILEPSTRRVVRSILLISMFLTSWAAMTWIAVRYRTPERIPVGTRIPREFPVLVISPGGSLYHVEIIPNVRLEEYVSGLRDYTFLVPKGRAGELNKRLAKGLRYEDNFEVRELPHGKQYLRVTWHWGATVTHVETGWYVAESRSFIAKYYQSTVTPIDKVFLWSPFTLMANVLLWSAGMLVHRRVKRRQGD